MIRIIVDVQLRRGGQVRILRVELKTNRILPFAELEAHFFYRPTALHHMEKAIILDFMCSIRYAHTYTG